MEPFRRLRACSMSASVTASTAEEKAIVVGRQGGFRFYVKTRARARSVWAPFVLGCHAVIPAILSRESEIREFSHGRDGRPIAPPSSWVAKSMIIAEFERSNSSVGRSEYGADPGIAGLRFQVRGARSSGCLR